MSELRALNTAPLLAALDGLACAAGDLELALRCVRVLIAAEAPAEAMQEQLDRIDSAMDRLGKGGEILSAQAGRVKDMLAVSGRPQ